MSERPHKVLISSLDEEFFKAVGSRISDYYEFNEGQLVLFLKRRHSLFHVDNDAYVRALEFDESRELNLSKGIARRFAGETP